jgi:hypothetical protein
VGSAFARGGCKKRDEESVGRSLIHRASKKHLCWRDYIFRKYHLDKNEKISTQQLKTNRLWDYSLIVLACRL